MGFRVGQGLIERYGNVHILQNELVTSVEHVFFCLFWIFFFNWNCVQTYSRLSKLQGRTGHNEVHLQRLLDKGVQEAGGQPQNEPSGKRTRQLRNLLFNNGIKDPDSLHPPPCVDMQTEDSSVLLLPQGTYVLQDNKFCLLTQLSSGKQYLDQAPKVNFSIYATHCHQLIQPNPARSQP